MPQSSLHVCEQVIQQSRCLMLLGLNAPHTHTHLLAVCQEGIKQDNETCREIDRVPEEKSVMVAVRC